MSEQRRNETGQWLPGDLAEVVATADPIPFDVVESLKASFSRRSTEAEVAELVYDSVLDEPVGVRSDGGSRHLSFQGPKVTVEMSVAPERRRVVGQLDPPLAGEVEVRQASGSYVVEIDELGRFVTPDVPKGPVSFRCRGADSDEGVVAVTDWIVL